MKVLFIGATGLVGSHAVSILKDKYDITPAAIDGGEVAGMPVQQIDVVQWHDIESVIKNGTADGEKFDAVVYCVTADYHGLDRSNAESMRRYYETCIEVNARGAYHVFEAAWRAGVSRVVHIGSMTAVLGPPLYDYIDVDTPNRPNDLYAVTKIFGENVGRSYAYRQAESGKSMKVLCLRLGQPCIEDEPRTLKWINSKKSCGMALDVRDIASAIECCLTTDVQYGVYPIVSAADIIRVNPASYAELGYKPQWKYDFVLYKKVKISAVS
ncbi:MAG: NAD(P)-dependent oxidoreductase [Abditibacteriaceae bacterium]